MPRRLPSSSGTTRHTATTSAKEDNYGTVPLEDPNGQYGQRIVPESAGEVVDELEGEERDNPTGWHPPWHFQALHMILSGHSYRDVAKAVHRNFMTVYRLMKTPWAKQQLQDVYRRLDEKRAAVFLDPIEKFNSKIDEKIALLDELTRSEDQKVALAAIKEWINHSIGSPVKRTEITVEHTLDKMGVEELRFIKENGRMPLPQELKLLQHEPRD